MQGVLALIRKLRISQDTVFVLVLGLDNAGKTTILHALAGEGNTATTPTQGFCIKTLVRSGVRVALWDVGSGAAQRPYWRTYVSGVAPAAGRGPAVAFVVDAADPRLLAEAGAELAQLLEEDSLAGAPLLVFANKQDKCEGEHDVTSAEATTAAAATAGPSPSPPAAAALAAALGLPRIRDRAWRVQACSALRGDGLAEGMAWLLQKCGAVL